MSWSISSGLGNASFADLAHAVIQKLPLTKADELAGLQELERAVCARRRALEVEASGQPESRPAEETAARMALGGQFAQLPAGQFAQSPAAGSGPRFTRDGALDDSAQHRAVGGLDSGDGRREWKIAPESLDIKEQIGSGAMGRVCVGNWQGTEVAVKILSDTRIAECASALRLSLPAGGSRAPSESRGARRPLLFLHIYAYTSLAFRAPDRELFVREVDMMARLHHPHIVQFLGFAQAGASDELGIVMELFLNRSVADYVQRGAKTAPHSIGVATKRRFCSEMAKAVSYLHNRKPTFLIHRDIKPSNFMLTNSLRVKLCDFGLSRLFRHRESGSGTYRSSRKAGVSANLDQTANCGTARFMAPEVYTADTALEDGGEAHAMYSTAIDIFSLGLVYYFVFVRELPRIQDATNAPAYFAALRSGRRPDFTSDTPKSARAVITACWETEPQKRPSASEIVDWWCEIEATSGGCGFGRGSVANIPAERPSRF